MGQPVSLVSVDAASSLKTNALFFSYILLISDVGGAGQFLAATVKPHSAT